MQFKPQPLEPPPQALRKFCEDLSEITAEFLQFAPPSYHQPISQRDMEREDRRRTQYFDRHQSGRVLNVCWHLIVEWYQAASSGLGSSLDQTELIREIARRFPIVLRQHTPEPLRAVMERSEFEEETLALVEDSLLPSSVTGEGYVVVAAAPVQVLPREPAPSAASPAVAGAPEPKPSGRSKRPGTRDPRATLLALTEWNVAQLQTALQIAEKDTKTDSGRGFLRKLSRDAGVPYTTLHRFTRNKNETLKADHQAKLAGPVRRILSRPVG